MNEKTPLADKALEELALKLEAELPEEISQLVTFGQSKDGKNLAVDWDLKLALEDLKLLTDIVAGYGGSYTNMKDSSGKDRGCFLIPKNQPPPAIPQQQNPKHEETHRPPETTAKVPPKTDQEIRQQSPLTLFQGRYCNCCSDLETCTPRTSMGRQRLTICFRVMELQYLDFIAERLHKLAQIQEENGKRLLQIQQNTPQPSSQAKPQQPTSMPAPPVRRNTRPEQGHIDLGIVWTNEVGGRGQYEKASEKDNSERDAYFQLEKWIEDHEDKPFKDGYYYWIFDQGASAIGRKRTQKRSTR
jgi:hypothetical protein